MDGSGQKWSERVELKQNLREVYSTTNRMQGNWSGWEFRTVFRGNHLTRVDEKGRLKMPAEFKRRVDEIYGPQFYITSQDGRRAQLYPLKEWEKKEELLAKMPASNPARMRFLDVTSYYGQMAEMDQQGRLLLPQLLREEAKITAEVVVLGKQGILEVVNHDDYKNDAKPLTTDELAALAEYGL